MRILSGSKRRWALLLLVVAVFALVSQVEASDGMRGDRCEVRAEDYIVEDFYFFCRILDVRGTIDGDLIGVAAEITVHRGARVTGDLWVGGGKLIVEGTIGDDIHFGGLTVAITERARFTSNRIDLTSMALNTEIRANAVLPGDLLVYGYQAVVEGTVGGDIDFSGEALVINGVVVGRVDAEVGDSRRSADVPNLPIYDLSFTNPGLWVGPEALIGEDVVYSSVSESEVPAGTVKGRLRFVRVGAQPDITKVARPDDAAAILRDYFVASLRDVITLLILGGVGLWLVPDAIRQPAIQVWRRSVPAIGWGLGMFMLAIPLVIVVFFVGLLALMILYLIKLNALTIMVGVAVVLVTGGLLGIFSFLIFFMGRVVVSFMIGQMVYRYVLRIVGPGDFRRWMKMLIIGAVIYALVTNMPVPALGLIIELITGLAGVGAVAMYVRSLVERAGWWGTRREVFDELAVAPASPPPSAVTPDELLPPGLENLPPGFKGFDEDW